MIVYRLLTSFVLTSSMIAIAAPARASDEAELMYECSVALEYSAKKGERQPISSDVPQARFDALTRNDSPRLKKAKADVEAVWSAVRKRTGGDGFHDYVLGVAKDCADYFSSSAVAKKTSPRSEPQLSANSTMSASALRAHVERTGDFAAVAYYLVYHYPRGKDLFQDNADGDYLGQIIVEVGAAGLRRFSDEAIYTIANKHYWQYNPPATRLVWAEYQRRLRVKRQTENAAQQWAKRAADDRAEQARAASASYVGSLGSRCENRRLVDQRGVTTSTYTVCKR